MEINFEENTWPKIKESIDKNALVIIPVGAIEEHGHHLPVNTDMVIARKICEAVALGIKDKIPVLVTPDVWPAYNGTKINRTWPGSLTIKQETQKKLLYELAVDLIEMGFKKMVFI